MAEVAPPSRRQGPSATPDMCRGPGRAGSSSPYRVRLAPSHHQEPSAAPCDVSAEARRNARALPKGQAGSFSPQGASKGSPASRGARRGRVPFPGAWRASLPSPRAWHNARSWPRARPAPLAGQSRVGSFFSLEPGAAPCKGREPGATLVVVSGSGPLNDQDRTAGASSSQLRWPRARRDSPRRCGPGTTLGMCREPGPLPTATPRRASSPSSRVAWRAPPSRGAGAALSRRMVDGPTHFL
jgi:hypothetical protein